MKALRLASALACLTLASAGVAQTSDEAAEKNEGTEEAESGDSKPAPDGPAKRQRTPRRPRPSSAGGGGGQPFRNPHGPQSASPRVMPASDLASGVIEVRLFPQGVDEIEGREVTLSISKQSIEQGNVAEVVTARTDVRGAARFEGRETSTDFIYRVSVDQGPGSYSTAPFQFRPGVEGGLRITIPLIPATSDLSQLVLISRALMAIIPKEGIFVVDVLWRIENYSKSAWVPKNVVFPLPEDFEALTLPGEDYETRFVAAEEQGVRLAGTFTPGRHDMSFRFHLPLSGNSGAGFLTSLFSETTERSFSFPTSLNLGSMRVLLEGSPSMSLDVSDFPKPEESRNQNGQRRLIASRDFLTERTRPPEKIELKISGIPTPPAGRYVAALMAFLLAAGGLFTAVQGRHSPRRQARSQLSGEDLERASELLLSELVELERAFEKGGVGRKMYERTRRQLLEAFARLRAEHQERPA